MYLINPHLQIRQNDESDCTAPCGFNGQYCCAPGSVCYTSDGIAGCTATNAVSAPVPDITVTCSGEDAIACGGVCCNASRPQFCALPGQCVEYSDVSSSAGGKDGSGIGSLTVSGSRSSTTASISPSRTDTDINTTTGDSDASSLHTTPAAGEGGGTSSPDTTNGNGGTSAATIAGTIAGPVVGAVVGIILIGLLFWFIYRRRGAKKEEQVRFEKAELPGDSGTPRKGHGGTVHELPAPSWSNEAAVDTQAPAEAPPENARHELPADGEAVPAGRPELS